MTEYNTIQLGIAGAIATITLNRPDELNAMTTEMFEDIIHAVGQLPSLGARVLLMTGAGRGFSSGASLSGDGGLPDYAVVVREGLNRVVETLWAMDIPFVTAVNGPAAGAGCPLALSGDIVIAARSAFFMQAFTNVGLIPDGGSSWLLPRLIGRARAMRMMMLADRIPAGLAEQWGMITEVVDDDALMPRAREIAQRFATGPTQSYRMIRQAVRAGMESTLSETLEIEADNQGAAGKTADHLEGVMAFVQKRTPEFSGT